MIVWYALRRLLPLLAAISLALTPVIASAATGGMHASLVAQAVSNAPSVHHHDSATHKADTAMDDMPCCPHEKAAKPDCAKGCPLMALCLATVASLLPTAVALPVPVGSRAALAWPSAASFDSLHGTPFPEPPRT